MPKLRPPESAASRLAALPPAERILALEGMGDRHALELLYDWDFWARASQREPEGNWFVWLRRTGRGEGKTRSGSEFARRRAAMYPRGALVGRTAADVRDVMVEGESGILATSPPWFRPEYEPSKRKLTWPNGSIALTFSADEPAVLRGPQHYWAWGDEVAHWKYDESWENLELGTRLGPDPRICATTTPKPVPLMKRLDEEFRRQAGVVVTSGTTYDNLENLSPVYQERVIRRYEGTRLARQELMGELIEDNPDAPLNRDLLDLHRVWKFPDLTSLMVAVDPPGSSGEANAEAGIVVGGKAKGPDGRWHAYILDDASLHGSPEKWAKQAIAALNRASGDAIIAEVNFGGDMVESTIKAVDDLVRVVKIRASRGKARRSQPVVALYEQGLVHHLGRMPELEDQWCQIPLDDEDSLQDRRDACVWLVTYLLLEGEPEYGKHYGVG